MLFHDLLPLTEGGRKLFLEFEAKSPTEARFELRVERTAETSGYNRLLALPLVAAGSIESLEACLPDAIKEYREILKPLRTNLDEIQKAALSLVKTETPAAPLPVVDPVIERAPAPKAPKPVPGGEATSRRQFRQTKAQLAANGEPPPAGASRQPIRSRSAKPDPEPEPEPELPAVAESEPARELEHESVPESVPELSVDQVRELAQAVRVTAASFLPEPEEEPDPDYVEHTSQFEEIPVYDEVVFSPFQTERQPVDRSLESSDIDPADPLPYVEDEQLDNCPF
jgi:hypothetical protein